MEAPALKMNLIDVRATTPVNSDVSKMKMASAVPVTKVTHCKQMASTVKILMSAHRDQQTAPRVRDAITRRGRIGVEPVPRGQRLTRPQGFVERSPSVPVGSPITQPQAHVKIRMNVQLIWTPVRRDSAVRTRSDPLFVAGSLDVGRDTPW